MSLEILESEKEELELRAKSTLRLSVKEKIYLLTTYVALVRWPGTPFETFHVCFFSVFIQNCL